MSDSRKQQAAELRKKKQHTIALLELPLLRVKAEEALRPKGIPFLVETLSARNYLVIHIVNEYFFYIPLTSENVDRRLGLVPYCLHRPDLAHEEIPDIRKLSNWGQARRWAALTAPAAPPTPAEG